MTPGVDFFRVHRGAPVKRRVYLASVLVAIGGTVVGAHLMHRLGGAGRYWSLAGGITLLAGLLLGFGTLALLLFDNVWLAIRDAGIVLHDDEEERVIGWEDLGDVTAESDGTLVFGRREAEAVRFYGGRDAPVIVSRVEAARRRGRLGLRVAG